ncbi:MAG: molybdopterin molybdotransferase MoeA [Bacteroidia bacterium]|nr:molybdopterin molybdotransferase MoeA [Bacteroidia bacterium]
MISFEKAYETVLASAFRTGSETVSFTETPGRILAQEVISDMDMPPFDKSTVDGFACRRADLDSELSVIETIAAGKNPLKSVHQGECSKIMTGAPMPAGADCVIMVEESETQPSGKIRFTGTYSKKNISFRGEDIKSGDVVLKPGKYLTPQDIALMATVGCTNVKVSMLPVIGVISSGDELVEPDQIPGLPRIRNSNAYQLMAQAKRAGCSARYYGIARDDEQATFEMVKKGVEECDILLLTGGVSMGDFDFVPSVLERAGIKLLFTRVNVQPGKPTTFGVHTDCLVFGLPGNPVSSYVQFEMLVRPLIYYMMGNDWKPFTCELPMKESYSRRSSDRLGFVPVLITDQREVLPVEYHGSAHITSISVAQGIIAIPPGRNMIEKGEIVSVRQI